MIRVNNTININQERLDNKKRKRQIVTKRVLWSLFTSFILVLLIGMAYLVSLKYNIIDYIVEEYMGKKSDVAYAEQVVKIAVEAVVATITILTIAGCFRKSTRYVSTEALVAQGGTYSDRYLAMADKLQHSELIDVWPDPGKECQWWFAFQDEKGTIKKFAIELQKVINNLISEPAIDLDTRSYIVRPTDDVSLIKESEEMNMPLDQIRVTPASRLMAVATGMVEPDHNPETNGTVAAQNSENVKSDFFGFF